MSGARRTASIAANPILIGAITALVVVVAVFLAYNANSGLPFVPTYAVNVQVPNAAGLVRGNDVRIGGTRVGTVSSIKAQTLKSGRVIAVLGLKLETVVKPLPTDTQVLIRPRSALGLKYVELTRGTRDSQLAEGATIPLRNATPQPVELDEFLDTFSTPTRRAIQQNLLTAGTAFAGRGQDLNFAVQDLAPLLDELTPVMANLASAKTDLRGMIRGLAQSAAVVAPVAGVQGDLVRHLDVTMSALESVARPYLQESISEGPATLTAATRDLPKLRPFLADATTLMRELQPGVAALASAAPDLATTVRVGTPVLADSPAFNARLEDTIQTLETFSTDALVKAGVRDLTQTTVLLNPTVLQLTPAQTVCNYVALWFRNVASLLSEGGTNGTMQRFAVITAPGSLLNAPNNEGGPSSAPANGPTGPGYDPKNFLHANPYPYTAASGQPKTCAAGNEKFIGGKTVIGNVPGQRSTTLHDDSAP
ncbi:unannotated protein [freshwater metagenome]|uniref:Unannotated protein n=1 Tax=freshwater metagenome TaxID=449393 RepID=A0A6J7J050_9ZZZZ|nr:MCE family protein [Actinomycetota bacterium]